MSCWLTLSLLISAVHADPDSTKLISKAKAMVENILQKKYEDVGKDFNKVMKEKLPPKEVQALWEKIEGQVGKLKKYGKIESETKDENRFILIRCEFEKAKLDLKVPFDGDDNIAGFFLVQPRPDVVSPPPSYAKQDSFTEKPVTVGEGEWKLPGTLTIPKGEGPFPGVVLVHGSGSHDRDETIGPNKPFRDLAWGLASHGVAVLRYEKRTLEHGVKLVANVDKLTIKEETIDDAVTAARLMMRIAQVDKTRVYVLGHSLGGMVGPKIALEEPKIAGLIIMAGNARPLEDLVLEQYTYLLGLDKKLTDEEKKILDEMKKKVAAVKDPKLSSETKAESLPFNMSAAYWLALREYSPTETIAKLKRPVLVIQGGRDYQVTMDDVAAWKKALADHKQAKIRVYANLNHLFMPGKGKAIPSEYEKVGHVAKEVVEDLAHWLKAPEK